jgi:hypothetical protein
MDANGWQNPVRIDRWDWHDFFGPQNASVCVFLPGDFWRVFGDKREAVFGGDSASTFARQDPLNEGVSQKYH